MAQPDLFDFLPGAAADRAERAIDPLVCLRDHVPTALEAVMHLSFWESTDVTSPHASHGYAYIVCRAGLRYERASEWWGPGAWNRKPRNLLAWTDLAALIGDDPRRLGIAAWAESLPVPRWTELHRPHELWPEPEKWHPSYIADDHERPGWDARIAAWRTVRAILTDAAQRVSAGAP